MDYYKTKESVDEYIKMAEGHSGAALIEKLKKFLPKKSSLLELGTGPGTDWKLLSTDYLVTGSDNSVEFLNRLIEREPDAEFLELNATTIDTNKKFDGIYSNKVLHHLNDQELEHSIGRQTEILNPGGVICHSFWKGEGSEVFKGLFVNSHMEKDLITYFEPFFEVLLIESYPEFDADDSILFIGRKKH